MKKTILMIVAIMAMLLMSCAPTREFSFIAGALDYRAIPGVFITESNSVSFDYEPIGSITVIEISGNTKKQKQKVKDIDDIYGKAEKKRTGDYYYTVTTTSNWREADLQSALNYAAEKVKELGGDGLINLKTDIDLDENRNIDKAYVTGMVIKRK